MTRKGRGGRQKGEGRNPFIGWEPHDTRKTGFCRQWVPRAQDYTVAKNEEQGG